MVIRRLSVIVICMAMVVAMPLVANALTIYAQDFDSYTAGTTEDLAAGWTSTINGACVGEVNNAAGFEMYVPNPVMAGPCITLEVGPVNVEGYNGIQVSAQWQRTSQTAANQLEFEFSWTGPSAGTSLTFFSLAEISANSSFETVSSGVAIPDDAIDVTLFVRRIPNSVDTTILIDNIIFSAADPIPVMTKWGMLVFAVLTGLFSILYYLKRIRKVSYPDN